MTKEVQKYLKRTGIAALILAAGIIYWFAVASEPEAKMQLADPPEEQSQVLSDSGRTSEEERRIYVHVSGAVLYPDKVYTLQEGARVADAIEKAGGCSEDAELSGINLAGKLEDGQKIYIPRKGEEYSEEIYQESERNHLTDLNKADKIELDALPGIGPALAQRIIEYREEHGDFSEIEELKNVKGIGETVFEKLKDKITVE